MHGNAGRLVDDQHQAVAMENARAVRDVDERTGLFIDVVANIVASREAEIDFVDMRYSNGFSIGWRGDSSPANGVEREQSARSLVAGRQE